MDFFPLPTPRVSQVQGLRWIQDCYHKGYRDLMIAAPTGVGKTAIGSTVAAWAKASFPPKDEFAPGAYLLVMQKVLQDQIERELTRLGGKTKAALIKASIEYPCAHFVKCSMGLQEKRCPCVSEGNCNYKLAKQRFISSVVSVTNYSYFFTERVHVGKLEKRQFLVCDEAHNLARALLRHVDIVVNQKTMELYAPYLHLHEVDLAAISTLGQFTAWLEDDYLPVVQEQAELLAELSDPNEGGSQVQDAYDCAQHAMKIVSFLERVEENSRGWVFWQEFDRDDLCTLTARPLDAAPYFDQLVGDNASCRIYLSAYPGPKKMFCEELGLDPTRTAWLGLRSTFEATRRKIHLMGVGSLSRNNQELALPATLRLLVKIVEKNPIERGVIHTHSYALAEVAYKALRVAGFAERLIFPKNADERDAAMEKHAKTPAAILLSPSVGEGFDFRDELARWQVVLKAPFPGLGDAHTKALAERNPLWYRSETVKHFLQICGRGMRSEQDYCATYVLDRDVEKLLHEMQHDIPRWFRDAIYTSAGAPFFVEEPVPA